MKKKLLSAILSVAMVATVLAGCGGSSSSTGESTAAGDSAAAVEEGSAAASTNTSTDGVKITILNTKSEIQTQWEELAQEYKELTGVDVEVSVTVGDSPSMDITKRYASGEVPTIFMGDIQISLCWMNMRWTCQAKTGPRTAARLRMQLQRQADWLPLLY